MGNELLVQEEERPLTAQDIRAGVNLIQEVMRAVMKEGMHYGTIPGTPKPSLWKPGAEKILSTFRIAPEAAVDDLSIPDEARYRVMVRGISASGRFLGAGLGEASSSEAKYKWREAVCPAEWDATPEDRRREKWKRDGTTIKQVRMEPADVANTILKMAHKRAVVSMTLLVTGASDIFTQDIEDLPEEYLRQGKGGNSTIGDAPLKSDASKSPWMGTLASVTSKQGTAKKSGKPYTQYSIKTSGGLSVNTFDDKLAMKASEAADSMQNVKLTFHATKWGHDLDSLEVQDAPPSAPLAPGGAIGGENDPADGYEPGSAEEGGKQEVSPKGNVQKIDSGQVKSVWILLRKSSKKTEAQYRAFLKDRLGIESTSDIQASDYDFVCDWIMGRSK